MTSTGGRSENSRYPKRQAAVRQPRDTTLGLELAMSRVSEWPEGLEDAREE